MLTCFNIDDYDIYNIEINNTRDELLTNFGKSTIADRYLLNGET